MDALQISLRIVHIVAGVFWVGSAAFLFVFLEPTTRAIGPQAGPVMAHLNQRLKAPTVVLVSAATAILAGAILYWRSSGGLDVDWITSPVGLGFTVGAVAAIVAFVISAWVVRPTVVRMGELGGAVAASGGTPSPEQATLLQSLQRRFRLWGRSMLALLALSVVAMASARYLG